MRFGNKEYSFGRSWLYHQYGLTITEDAGSYASFAFMPLKNLLVFVGITAGFFGLIIAAEIGLIWLDFSYLR